MRKYTISEVDAMEGHQFEYFCAELLRANQFESVEVTPGSGDQGIDIIATKEDLKYGIQCKCYTGDIGNKAVQEAYSGKEYYGCHVGVVLTNRAFTASAVDLAKKNRIVLWDRPKLISLMKTADVYLEELETENANHARETSSAQEVKTDSTWESFQKEAEKLQQVIASEKDEERRKQEAFGRLALEESRRDSLKKEYDKISLIGGGAVVLFLLVAAIGWLFGDKIADTALSHLLMVFMVVALVAAAALMVYSKNLEKEYKKAQSRVDSLVRDAEKL